MCAVVPPAMNGPIVKDRGGQRGGSAGPVTNEGISVLLRYSRGLFCPKVKAQVSSTLCVTVECRFSTKMTNLLDPVLRWEDANIRLLRTGVGGSLLS
jgi:hypothetical protein